MLLDSSNRFMKLPGQGELSVFSFDFLPSLGWINCLLLPLDYVYFEGIILFIVSFCLAF